MALHEQTRDLVHDANPVNPSTSRSRIQLTERQAVVFTLVKKYHQLTGGGCPASIVAERLGIYHEAVRGHFMALHKKGWLVSEHSPAIPRQNYLFRRR